MATWTTDGSRADVVAKLASAADGDTITLPAGTFTDWTSSVSVSKGVTIQGAAPSTVASVSSISAANPAVVTTDSAHGLTSGACIWLSGVTGGTVAAGGPQTLNGPHVATVTGSNTFTIPKNVTAAPTASTGTVSRLSTIIEDNGSSERLMAWTLVNGYTSQLSYIEFRRGSRSGAYDGLIQITGTNTDTRRIRIEDCAFNNLNGFMLRIETALGVAANNVFRYDGSNFPFYIYHRAWNGGTYAEGSWSAATNFGSEAFWFIEDNVLDYYNSFPNHGAICDGYGGCRFVVRRNTIVRGQIEAHGTESSGRWRGARALEVYDNDFRGDDKGNIVVNLRSGTALFHGNRISKFQNPPDTPGPSFPLRNHRSFYPFAPWGQADGTNAWDKNIAGGPFASHTASSGTGQTVTVTGAGWTVNAWVGYSIKKTSNLGTGQNASYITANTSDTITYASDNGYAFSDPNKQLTFSAGHTFEIYRIDESLDMVGRSGGSSITGDTPTPWGSNDQVDDPVYCWDNTREGGVAVLAGGSHPSMRENEHYFNGTPKPGYTPYTYPHPLRDGSEPPPDPPPSGTASPMGNRSTRFAFAFGF